MIRYALFAPLMMLATCSPAATPLVISLDETDLFLSYTDAFVIEPIASRDMTIGGVSISAKGGDIRLIGAHSKSIGTIEIHTMTMKAGKMQMRHVDGLDIADGETLNLQKGGHHLMMFDIGEDVISGETINITLSFDKSGETITQTIEANVRSVGEEI